MCKIIKRVFLKITINQLICSFLFVLIIISLWSFRFHNENTNKKDIPVIMWWEHKYRETSVITVSSEHSEMSCSVQCRNSINEFDVHPKAYLFYGSSINFDDLPLPRRPNDIIWGLLHEESPRNVEVFMHEKTLSIFNFSATFSRHSNLPFTLTHLRRLQDVTTTEYFVPTPIKNSYLKEVAPILYLQTDCETSTERDIYVKELMKLIAVDSYGACLNNKQLPDKFTVDYLNNLYEEEFLKFIARYKFVVAIENGVCDDYITEKYWRAITVGIVPIYFGSPSIRDWLPNEKSAILLQDFPTPQILTRHIEKLLKNDSLYEEYLEHKTKTIITNERLQHELTLRPYQTDFLMIQDHFERLVCQNIYENMRRLEVSPKIVNKLHYNCPKPLSALTLAVNPLNPWCYSWEVAKEQSEKIYKTIMNKK